MLESNTKPIYQCLPSPFNVLIARPPIIALPPLDKPNTITYRNDITNPPLISNALIDFAKFANPLVTALHKTETDSLFNDASAAVTFIKPIIQFAGFIIRKKLNTRWY